MFSFAGVSRERKERRHRGGDEREGEARPSSFFGRNRGGVPPRPFPGLCRRGQVIICFFFVGCRLCLPSGGVLGGDEKGGGGGIYGGGGGGEGGLFCFLMLFVAAAGRGGPGGAGKVNLVGGGGGKRRGEWGGGGWRKSLRESPLGV